MKCPQGERYDKDERRCVSIGKTIYLKGTIDLMQTRGKWVLTFFPANPRDKRRMTRMIEVRGHLPVDVAIRED